MGGIRRGAAGGRGAARSEGTAPTLHGVNLSGWLELETWATPSLFSGSGAFDEASLASSMDAARFAEMLREHRETFVTEDDFAGIAARGFEAVRLPVPWFVFGDAGPLAGPSAGCIDYVDRAFGWAEAHGLEILLVIAAAPGDDPASPSSFFADTESFRHAMLDVLAGLCSRYAGRKALLGVQPVDEVRAQRRRGLHVTEGVPLHVLRNFYRDAYDTVRSTAGSDPVLVISDAGAPDAWRRFMPESRYDNVWLDCHLFHYADPMSASGPTGVRKLIDESRRQLAQAKASGLPVVVGAWSSALPLSDAGMTPEGRIALERVYTSGQLNAFVDARAWFFQTWKTEGRISSWDARVALSSFERGMFG